MATLRVVTEENQIVDIPLFPYREVSSVSGTIDNVVDVINQARINDARITRSDEHDLETTNIASVYSLRSLSTNYNKTIWNDGDIITDIKMNNIEDGIFDIDTRLDDVIKQVDEMLNPFNINTLTINPSVAQIGSTVSVTVKWSYSQDIKTQTINNEEIETSLREKTYDLISNNTDYTLRATSNNDIDKTKTVSLKFYNGIYYGKSNNTTYNAQLISSLTKVLSNSKNRTITVNASDGEYIYYCVPTRLGQCNFNVGGFDGGFDKVATIDYMNSNSYTEQYDIYKSTNAGLGNTTITIK